MSSQLLDKKKNNVATIIVERLRGKEAPMEMNTGEFEESYDHLKLAAYEFAEAAGLEVKNMEKLMRAFKRLHEYCHEEMEKDEYMGF